MSTPPVDPYESVGGGPAARPDATGSGEAVSIPSGGDSGVVREFPASPPTRPPGIAPRREQWPTVLGILSIVLGAMGVISGAWNALGMIMMSTMASGQGAAGGGSPPPGGLDLSAMIRSMGEWAGVMSGLNLLSAGLSVLLIIAGSGLVRRRRWGATWMVRWSILKIVLGAVLAAATAMMQHEQFKAMSGDAGQTPTDPAASAMRSMGPIMVALTAVVSLVWYWAYPVFVLIWMRRSPMRRTIAGWR